MTDMTEAHTITHREDGADLRDLVLLIEHLRANKIDHTLRGGSEFDLGLIVEWGEHRVIEREPLPEAYFVGNDGTVYDCNGEVL